jgi:biotin operon repressor
MVAERAGGDKGARHQWFETRLRLNTAIRRSRFVSDGAYRLWADLAFGWAWNDPSCFPSYEALSEALGVGRTTIWRWLSELEAHGLIAKRRTDKGNDYALITELPSSFDGAKIDNKKIGTSKKRRKPSHQKQDHDDCILKHRNEGSAQTDVSDVKHRSHDLVQTDVSEVERGDVSDVKHRSSDTGRETRTYVDDQSRFRQTDVSDVEPEVSKVHLSDVQEDKKYRKGKYERESQTRASEAHEGMHEHPSRFALGNEGTEDMSEADDLLEEAGVPLKSRTTQPRKKAPKHRASSSDLVSSSDGPSKIPFPEAQGASVDLTYVKFDPPATPPPVETPYEVLLLLKGEMESRWGRKGTHHLPMELSGDLSGRIKNVLLSKYPPDVILSMIRLLVWDWQVAREQCFPFRKGAQYPDVLALIQYAAELAVRIETGFVYTSNYRGAVNTYHDLFIRKIPFVQDDYLT